jgi:hypothetical protein
MQYVTLILPLLLFGIPAHAMAITLPTVQVPSSAIDVSQHVSDAVSTLRTQTDHVPDVADHVPNVSEQIPPRVTVPQSSTSSGSHVRVRTVVNGEVVTDIDTAVATGTIEVHDEATRENARVETRIRVSTDEAPETRSERSDRAVTAQQRAAHRAAAIGTSTTAAVNDALARVAEVASTTAVREQHTSFVQQLLQTLTHYYARIFSRF